jgi:transposase
MEKSEKLFVIKFFFRKGLSANAIYKELSTVLGPTAYSLAQVKNWCTRFTEGDLTCSDQLRIDRLRHMLRTDLSQFLQEFPFATARQLAENFNESKHTIKTILERKLGLRKFSRRWVPHSLSDSQKSIE